MAFIDKISEYVNKKIFLDSVISDKKDEEVIKVTVDDIEEVKNNCSNKSKIKDEILDVITHFYYIHFYETFKIGTDERYQQAIDEEIAMLQDEKIELEEKSVEKLFKAASSEKALEKAIEKQQTKQDTLDDKISELTERSQELKEQSVGQEVEQTLQSDVQQIIEANNQEEQSIQNNEEISLQPITEAPEEQPVEIEQELTQEELMISEEKRDFMAAVEYAFDQAMQKVEEKHAQEIQQIREDAANKITEAQNIVNQVSQEANDKVEKMKKENDELQSHYEQATTIVENQRKEIEGRDQTIAELTEQVATITEKDKEIARLQQIEASYIAIKNALSFNQPPAVEPEEKGKTL